MRGLFRQSVAVTLQIEIETYFFSLLSFFFTSVILPTRVNPPDKKNDGTQSRDINCYLPTCLNYRVIVAFKPRPSLVIPLSTAFVGFRMQFC